MQDDIVIFQIAGTLICLAGILTSIYYFWLGEGIVVAGVIVMLAVCIRKLNGET